MTVRHLMTECFILNKEASGESWDRHLALSGDHGLLLCLKRNSYKKPTSLKPDLFDHAELDLEQPANSKTWFIRHFHLIKRYDTIADNYNNLLYASELARMFAKNLDHAEHCGAHFQLFAQAMQSFASRNQPEVTFFKSLYVFARQEGYAVKQQWWQSLSETDRASTAKFINLPLDEQPIEPQKISRLIKHLKSWLIGHTDIMI